jgi:hypothetical protein
MLDQIEKKYPIFEIVIGVCLLFPVGCANSTSQPLSEDLKSPVSNEANLTKESTFQSSQQNLANNLNITEDKSKTLSQQTKSTLVAQSNGTNLQIINNGKPQSVIVIQNPQSEAANRAIAEFQYYIKQTSSIELPKVDIQKANTLPSQTVRIVFGYGSVTDNMGLDRKQLKPEAYRIKAQGNYLVFQGYESDLNKKNADSNAVSPATMWAVEYFADRYLGVRWLWPGEVGTYIPQHKSISLPPIDIVQQPQLLERKLRTQISSVERLYSQKIGIQQSNFLLTNTETEKLQQETNLWKLRHQLGSRSPYQFGHAFTDWWEKYHQTNPKLFGYSPQGKQVSNKETVKLNVGNEDVDETIIKEWQDAGAPDNWNVCENDGRLGYSISPESRAMDAPYRPSPEEIWEGKANMTPRYVRFWNRLIGKMRQINSDITLSAYAYGAISQPPPADLKIDPKIVIEVVPSYLSEEIWKAWSDRGIKVFLRPNWWHEGGIAPFIPLHQQGEFFQFARSNSMLGFDFDAILGDWSTKGPLYYLIARMSSRPDLSTDDIINEYASAFGKAAPAIRDYLKYWENYSQKLANSQQNLFKTASEKYLTNSSNRVTNLGKYWYLLPYLYTQEQIGPAKAILDRAEKLAASDAPVVKQRIQFLKNGLHHLEVTRDVIKLAIPQLRPKNMTRQNLLAKQQELQQLRSQLTPTHAVWGDYLNYLELKRDVPTNQK